VEGVSQKLKRFLCSRQEVTRVSFSKRGSPDIDGVCHRSQKNSGGNDLFFSFHFQQFMNDEDYKCSHHNWFGIHLRPTPCLVVSY
jgi:hypothetical protein